MTGPATSYCPNCGTPSGGANFCPRCGYSLAGGAPVGAPGGAPTGADPAAARPVAWGGVIALVGGALGVLGSFLPWITASAASVGTISRNGIDGGGDGIFTIIAGLLAALFGLVLLARSGKPAVARIGAIVCGLALIAVGVLDTGSVNSQIASLDTSVAIASVGMGLYVVILGGVIAILGGLIRTPKGS